MNTLLTISGLDVANVTATDHARATRDELLSRSKRGTAITTPESAQRAAALLAEVKGFTRMIEVGRTEVKAPVLALGKKIDGVAAELVDDLEREATRISKLLGAWQAEQNQIAEEKKRAAYEEELRIRREAEEKERLAREESERQARAAREEEERRQREIQEKLERDQAELRAKEERARSEAGRRRAQLEREEAEKRAQVEAARLKAEAAAREGERLLREQEEAQRRADEERQRIIDTRVSVAAVIPPKPAGVATRAEIKFEVTNIQELYEAAPYLVSLSPNVSALKAALKGLQPGQHLPGVRHWVEQVSIIR